MLNLFNTITGYMWVDNMFMAIDSNGIGNMPVINNKKYLILIYYVLLFIGNIVTFNLLIGSVIYNYKRIKQEIL